jgi:hypothetical protein
MRSQAATVDARVSPRGSVAAELGVQGEGGEGERPVNAAGSADVDDMDAEDVVGGKPPSSVGPSTSVRPEPPTWSDDALGHLREVMHQTFVHAHSISTMAVTEDLYAEMDESMPFGSLLALGTSLEQLMSAAEAKVAKAIARPPFPPLPPASLLADAGSGADATMASHVKAQFIC